MSDGSSSFQALAARIDRLEAQTRRLKVLLFVALVAVIVAGAAAGTVAQQRSISFKDSYGIVKVSADGLYLYDKHNVARMALYISNTDQPVMRLRDRNGKDRMFFGLTGSGDVPRMQYNDPAENERLYVGLTTQGTGQFQTYTAGGTNMTSIDDDQIRVSDDNGKQRIYLGVSSTLDPFLRMYNADSTVRLYAGIFTDGKAGFAAYDTDGTNTWSQP
jgi:hypothetical protein